MEEPILSGLDAALHELGMLSSVTESRREYQKEKEQTESNWWRADRETLGKLRMNSRFVTGVIFSSRNKGPSLRYKPYTPYMAREERARTKSENSDVNLDWFCSSTLTPLIPNTTESNGLYKSRSLENVKGTVSDEDDDGDNPTQEVESVSDKIQQLQVCE